jgi:hypothetical protein
VGVGDGADAESPKGKALPVVKIKADGTCSFTDTPLAGGKVTYAVKYAGSATHLAASASRAVTVSKDAATLTLNGKDKVYAYGSKVTLTAHLGKTWKNRTVKIYSDPAGDDKPKTLIKTGTVNSKGDLSATVTLSRDTRITAVYEGDSRTATKSATRWLGSQVKIQTAMSEHCKTKKVSGVTQYYYRTSATPIATTVMTAYKGRTQRLTLQFQYEGKWHDLDYGDFERSSKGKSAVNLGKGSKDIIGYRFRVRSSYIDGVSDSVNSTTHGEWKYFTFTK